MPIYEYEPDDRECFMCDGRVAVIQSLGEENLRYCPDCGLEVRRVVSRFNAQMSRGNPIEKGEKRDFAAWKRVEDGKWERISGTQGPDMIERPAEGA